MVPSVKVRVLVGQQETQAAQYTARLFYGPPSEALFDEVDHKKSWGGVRRPAWVVWVIIQPSPGLRGAGAPAQTLWGSSKNRNTLFFNY